MTSYPAYPTARYSVLSTEPPAADSATAVPFESSGWIGNQRTATHHGPHLALPSGSADQVGSQHAATHHGPHLALPSGSASRAGSQHTATHHGPHLALPSGSASRAGSSSSFHSVQLAPVSTNGSPQLSSAATHGVPKRTRELNAVTTNGSLSHRSALSQPAERDAWSTSVGRGPEQGVHGDGSVAPALEWSLLTRGAGADLSFAPRSSSSSMPRDAAARDGHHGATRVQNNRFRIATHLITFTLRLAALVRPPAPASVRRAVSVQQGSEASDDALSIPGQGMNEEANRQIVQDQIRESTSEILENGEIDFEEDSANTIRGVVANCVVLLVLVFALSIILLYISGWFVLLLHGQDPCDVPLAPWLLFVMCFNATTALAGASIRKFLYRTFWNWDPEIDDEVSLCMKMTLDAVHFSLVIGICFGGFWMTTHSKTCADTAPILFGWARLWIRLMLFIVVLRIVITVCGVALIAFMIAAGVWKTNEGADPDIINKIETVAYQEAGEGGILGVMAESGTIFNAPVASECSICFESYTDQQELKFTLCHHLFHEECLKNWLKIKRTCPLCRLDLQEALLQQAQNEEEGYAQV